MAALSAVEIIGIICMVEWGLIHIAAFFMMKGAWHDDIRSVYNAYDELMGVKDEYSGEKKRKEKEKYILINL